VLGADADPDERFPTAYDVSSAGVSLVRPDGFVAFRSREAVADPAAVLERALRSVLSLPAGP
jgi:hypothetical protein